MIPKIEPYKTRALSFCIAATEVVFTKSGSYPRIAVERRRELMKEIIFESGSVPVVVFARLW